MNSFSDTKPTEELNPYSPPAIAEELPKLKSPFTAEYWGVLTLLFFLSMPFIYFLPLVGLVAMVSVIFAFARSIMQLWRIRRDRLEAVANSISVSMQPFLLSSLGIGLLTTCASSIAFVTVCFPTGFAFFSFAPQAVSSAEFGSMGIVLVIAISLFAAMWIAALILRKSIR